MLSTLSMISLAVQAAALAPAEPQQATSAPPPMKCETGPTRRTFGGNQWIVYSCDDHASMVVVSVEDNPASPFYFFLKPTGCTYTVSGEGNGEKKASDAAGDALAKMTPVEFIALLAATNGGAR